MAEATGFRKIALRCNVDALTLDRFNNKCRDIARTQRAFKIFKIAKSHHAGLRQEWSEALAKALASIQRKCSHGQSMERTFSKEHSRTTSGGARKLDGCFNALGSTVREIDAVQTATDAARELPRQHPSKWRSVKLNHGRKVHVQAVDECLLHCWVVAADVADRVAAQEVQVPMPL